jgi:SAM-dependent methyltransferase
MTRADSTSTHTADRLILNLGCGSKTSSWPGVVNIDWSVMLRIRKNRLLGLFAPLAMNAERLGRLRSLPDNILVHDLRKGIPFPSNSADAVFHSHVMEHIDRNAVPAFLQEIKRVLKEGGIHRVVLPDLELLCNKYLAHLAACSDAPEEQALHDGYVAEILEQSVRREAAGTSRQTPARRFVENVLLGDARRRGETHQWMYDRVNLTAILTQAGFRQVTVQTHTTSAIPDWNRIGLDLDGSGRPHKPGSLYIEALK